jgi:hypothetical protein
MNTRYLPRDHNTLDLYAEANPVFAEHCSQLASSLACEDRVPAREWSYYYGLLREAVAADARAAA